MGGAGVCVPRIMDSASQCVSVSFRIGTDRTRNDRRSIRTGRVIMSAAYDTEDLEATEDLEDTDDTDRPSRTATTATTARPRGLEATDDSEASRTARPMICYAHLMMESYNYA